MADDFEFTDEALNQARRVQRLRNLRVAERIGQAVGAAGEMAHSGTDAATAFGKRPLFGETMSAKEKLEAQQAILPSYGTKESQQQALGYSAVNDNLNRLTDEFKAALRADVQLAGYRTTADIASDDRHARERRFQAERADKTLKLITEGTPEAERMLETAIGLIEKEAGGAYNSVYEAEKAAGIRKHVESLIGPPPVGGTLEEKEEYAASYELAAADTPMSTFQEIEQRAGQVARSQTLARIEEAAPMEYDAFIGSLGDMLTDTHVGAAYYDKRIAVQKLAARLGMPAEKLVAHWDKFNPEAASIAKMSTMQAATEGENAYNISTDVRAQEAEALRVRHGSGYGGTQFDQIIDRHKKNSAAAAAAGGLPGADALLTQDQALGQSLGQPLQGTGARAAAPVGAQPAAEAPDVGAAVGRALADEMAGVSPAPTAEGAIEATQQEIVAEQTAAAEQAAAPPGDPPVMLGLTQSQLESRMPGFQMPSDAVGRYRAMLGAIEAFPEHPPAIQAKRDMLESPLFKDYMQSRNYSDPEFAYRHFQKEARAAHRRRKIRDRKQLEFNKSTGIADPDAYRLRPAKTPSREKRAQGLVLAAPAGVPESLADHEKTPAERAAERQAPADAAQKGLAPQP